MFDYHALFELVGILAIGYIIAHLLLKIPMLEKFLIYPSKEGVNRTDNPNPVNDADNLKIREGIISQVKPVKHFNECQNHPLGNHPPNVPSSPLAKKTDNSAHIKGIIGG